MKIKDVEGIIWDLDGTILNSFGVFEAVIADIVKKSGHKMPSRNFIMKNFHGSLEDTLRSILKIDSAEELNQVVSFFLVRQELHYEGDINSHLFLDAITLVQSAAKLGIHQLLVTNRDNKGRGKGSPKAIIASTVLADYIHEIRSGDDVEYRKPDKRSIGDWIERNHLDPSKVLVIGDQYVDAQLAINIGARSVLIKRYGEIPHLNSLTHQNPDVIIVVDSLKEIVLS